MKTDKLISSLLELNPDLSIRKGKRSSHYRVIKNGMMIGIIPVKLSKEGLADNTRSQFRRNGVLLPGEEINEREIERRQALSGVPEHAGRRFPYGLPQGV